MANQASPQLVWQLVRNNNCYLKKNINNTWFAAEPGNLRGRSSYKYSGICNEKALSIGLPTGEDAAGISVTRKTKKGSFKTFNHKGKGAKRVVAAVGKDVSSYRQDLAREAMHVASVAHAASRRRASSSDDE